MESALEVAEVGEEVDNSQWIVKSEEKCARDMLHWDKAKVNAEDIPADKTPAKKPPVRRPAPKKP